MFFLMLLAGIRMEPLDFVRTSKLAILVALGGMIVPVSAGLVLGLIVLPGSPLKLVQSPFLGTALAITALPVSVRIFMDVCELDTRVGKTVIAAALWDDLISLFLLALLIAATGGGGLGAFDVDEALLLLGKVVLFLQSPFRLACSYSRSLASTSNIFTSRRWTSVSYWSARSRTRRLPKQWVCTSSSARSWPACPFIPKSSIRASTNA